MADSTSLTATIEGLVDTLNVYVAYKVGMKQAANQGTPAPPRPEDRLLRQGSQVHEAIKKGVDQYGDQYEQTDLANYEKEPDRYKDFLVHMLYAIANRSPDFSQELRALAQQHTAHHA